MHGADFVIHRKVYQADIAIVLCLRYTLVALKPMLNLPHPQESVHPSHAGLILLSFFLFLFSFPG